MTIVIANRTTLLKVVKPFKTGWKVITKVLHSWTRHSSYGGGDTLEFILADITGDKIQCTCKRIFTPRAKKHTQIGQCYRKNRPTSHKYKPSIIGSSVVTNSPLKIDENFLSLTPYQSIINGSLNSNFLIDITSQAIDIGELQVVQVNGKERKKLDLTLTDNNNHQITCCLWGHFAEIFLNAYQVGKENTIVCLVRFAKISVYKVQVTNAFEISNMIINPIGSDVQDFFRELPSNELALITGNGEVVKPKGLKHHEYKWYLYLKRSILDIIMATEIEKCIVKATILAIDTEYTLYYFGCLRCNKKVTNITKKELLISNQPMKHVWGFAYLFFSNHLAIRFKLHLLLKNDTGETKMLLLVTIVEPISGFGVYVNKENVDYRDDIFNIGWTWSIDAIISKSEDDNDEDSNAITLSFERSSGHISLISMESEEATCLTSTPLSKHNGDIQIDDLSSTSKKQCSKPIKVENIEDE
ncbi:hypothetical protein N665_1120s0002 [Sinapis alba]|nr:hypothetical protein N665_1120s0002 [Sinapis alba]